MALPPASNGATGTGAPLPPAFARCVRRDCACHLEGASFNGLPGNYCCRTCQRGTPCTFAWHKAPFECNYINSPAGAAETHPSAPAGDIVHEDNAGASTTPPEPGGAVPPDPIIPPLTRAVHNLPSTHTLLFPF